MLDTDLLEPVDLAEQGGVRGIEVGDRGFGLPAEGDVAVGVADIEYCYPQVIPGFRHGDVVRDRPLRGVFDPGILDHPKQANAADSEEHDQDREANQPLRPRFVTPQTDHPRLTGPNCTENATAPGAELQPTALCYES
jgi:hypothetical protein